MRQDKFDKNIGCRVMVDSGGAEGRIEGRDDYHLPNTTEQSTSVC